MTILYPAPAQHNPARRFGAGLMASRPSYREPYTSADLAWLLADDLRRAAEDREFDRMAAEAAFMDRYESGIAG